jgi:hypothetical protein
MNKIVITVVVALAVIGAGALFIAGNNENKQTPTPTTSSQTTTSSSVPAEESAAMQPTDSAAEPAATITITDDGYSPKIVTVKRGAVVKVVNTSSQKSMFSSDPHPSHTKNNELNQSTIPPGGSQTFKVTLAGTFGFHDHLQSRYEGTLIVE